MQIKDVRPASFVKQIRCDRCDRLAEVGDAELEFQEFVSIDLKAGYASIFGDGNHVQVDLCQHCLTDVLGRWLRIPAEEVIGKLRAKVDAARKRRVIGMLRGKSDAPANFDDPLPEEVLQDFEGRLTTDTTLTVTTRTKDDPGFVEALLNEAIELAANGEPELAKRVLRDLIVGTKR